jgi:hypothetical protein
VEPRVLSALAPALPAFVPFLLPRLLAGLGATASAFAIAAAASASALAAVLLITGRSGAQLLIRATRVRLCYLLLHLVGARVSSSPASLEGACCLKDPRAPWGLSHALLPEK